MADLNGSMYENQNSHQNLALDFRQHPFYKCTHLENTYKAQVSYAALRFNKLVSNYKMVQFMSHTVPWHICLPYYMWDMKTSSKSVFVQHGALETAQRCILPSYSAVRNIHMTRFLKFCRFTKIEL